MQQDRSTGGSPPAEDEPRKPQQGAGRQDPDEVDEASDESFPASDPPAFNPSHAGGPAHDGQAG